ncbi:MULTISPECIES: OmpA family protein [Actinomyces]|uniref:OmpA family protein n=1 Tax=Actinomyces respiraculi TaxID=2744574 RepID=A0A7T0LJI8_9ACTO|nr:MULTISPECIES: OmpA family protein [Actinomyces]QPL04951.1 OmpA family protein [Actinomyces respiraculi]
MTVAPHHPLLSRRHALALPLVAGAAHALAACGARDTTDPQAGASSPTAPEPSAAQAPSAAATAGAPVSVRLTGALGGHTLDVRLGPLVRVDASSSVLPFHVERPADDPNQEWLLSPSFDWAGPSDEYGLRWMRLIDPLSSRVWRSTATRDAVHGGAIDVGEARDYYATFGGVDPDVESVVVMLNQSGFVPTAVIDLEQAQDPDLLRQVLDDAEPASGRLEPLALEHYTEAVNRSASGLTTKDAVTVTVSNDVSFATDSAELTSQADTILQGVADSLASYPDGGALSVVGHTDDVADDAYNQALSERRAQAVWDRLTQLTDLSAWSSSVTGKGESEPRQEGTSEEARAANRRVEIVIAPTAGTDGHGSRGLSSDTAPPAPAGPSAPGPQGVSVARASDGESLTITLEQVVRRGGLLFGEFVISDMSDNASLSSWFTDNRGWGLDNARGESVGVASIQAASGVTLLSGGSYVFPVDYLPPGADGRRPLADLYLASLGAGTTGRVCVVWPDTGEDTVIVDRPADSSIDAANTPWRLTDVPVVAG